MFKQAFRIMTVLLLIQLPFVPSALAASSVLPSQFTGYEESYYFSHNGEESQAPGSLITFNQDSFIPVEDVASLLGLKMDKEGETISLSGEPILSQTPKISGSLAKDATIDSGQLKINPAIGAGAVIMLTDDQAQPIFSKNENQSLYPSSTMKIMTALIAIENGNLHDTVIIGPGAAKVPSDSSKAGVLPGERMSLEQLLYALMLPSGNDAAVAIAEHISGSEQKFVQLMNKRAQELGATRTKFLNAHGYHNANQQTTANDLAKIAKEASTHPIFMKIVNTPSYYTTYIGKNGLPKSKAWRNTNKLIQKDSPYYTSSVLGGKTGYTRASRYNLVSFAESNGHQYVTVLLRGEKNQRFSDTRNLLQSAYTKRASIESSKTIIQAVPFTGTFIVNGKDLTNSLTLFIRNGTTYVSTDVIPMISADVSSVKRSDSQKIKAALNSTLLTFDRVEPTLQNGRMLVPLRTFFEEAGLQLNWDQKTQTIEGQSSTTSIKMTVDSKHANVNGQHVILDVPATVVNGRTLVPIRFISESTGSSVDWGRGRTLYLY